MSKSEGNIIRVNDFVLQYSPNILRVLLTQTQYSKPVNVNDDSINNAGSVISKIENLILKQVKVQEDFTKIKDETFISILKNDLDTPNAFAHIFEQIKNINASADAYEFQKMLFNLDLLGIKVEINEQKVKEYQEALTKEDFERSDILRKEVVSI
jgi:cysteinyl-tRNA synthetase